MKHRIISNNNIQNGSDDGKKPLHLKGSLMTEITLWSTVRNYLHTY